MKRTKTLRMVFLMLLLALAGRLCYVQILCADELTAAAHSQQLIPVLQENGKGVIYDRNMTPLTGTDHAYYYLIHKDNLTAGAERQLALLEAEPAGQKGEDYLVYRTTFYVPNASELLQNQYQAYGFAVDVRYGDDQTAGPLITDLDVMYDGLLQKEEASFYFLGNAAGGLFRGTGVMPDGENASAGLITTIDASMQQKTEEMFEEKDVTGCVVVTNTRNGQILAMVSRGRAGTTENLAVEHAWPIGALYQLVKKTAGVLYVKPSDAAATLGLGTPVFDDYPGEDAGKLAGVNTTATAVQMSRLLVTLANQGEILPLSLVMSAAKEESIPCMEMTGDAAEKLEDLYEELAKKALSGDGWAAGYSGNYAVIVHLEKGNPETIYDLIVNRL